MNSNYKLIIAWASHRVTHLDTLQRYEDSYAVSQEFCEWTTSFNSYPEIIKVTTLKVPVFYKENRTSKPTQ